MTTSPPLRHMFEVSGEEAWYLLGGISQGRMVYEQRDALAVRPAAHVVEYGRLIVRTPAPGAAFFGRVGVTYHCDYIHPNTGTGWAVTTGGLAEVITGPDEAAHYRRTLPGWSHGPHDTLLYIHPQTTTGFRFTHSTETGTASGAARRPQAR